jgi:hypothetical protein
MSKKTEIVQEKTSSPFVAHLIDEGGANDETLSLLVEEIRQMEAESSSSLIISEDENTYISWNIDVQKVSTLITPTTNRIGDIKLVSVARVANVKGFANYIRNSDIIEEDQ